MLSLGGGSVGLLCRQLLLLRRLPRPLRLQLQLRLRRPRSLLHAPTTPASRANVTYANGLLTVSATNSSLNQILREISRQTGMKITGGVTDERVFGNYGPGSPATILATLLDGTGSNMLLVQSNGVGSNPAPAELVLTPRHGGPTPPNPNAPGFNDGAERG